MTDNIIVILNIIENLLFQRHDFWHDNYLKARQIQPHIVWSSYLVCSVPQISDLEKQANLFPD